MNRYDVEHVKRMLSPLLDEIESLSEKIKKLNHDFNNIRTVLSADRDLAKISFDEISKSLNDTAKDFDKIRKMITKKE